MSSNAAKICLIRTLGLGFWQCDWKFVSPQIALCFPRCLWAPLQRYFHLLQFMLVIKTLCNLKNRIICYKSFSHNMTRILISHHLPFSKWSPSLPKENQLNSNHEIKKKGKKKTGLEKQIHRWCQWQLFRQHLSCINCKWAQHSSPEWQH